MTTSVLEQTRAVHEKIESLEKVMSKILADRASNLGKAHVQVKCEAMLEETIKEIQDSADYCLELYEDTDGLRAEELDLFAGVSKDRGDNFTIWNAFYEKLKETKNYHRKNPVKGGIVPPKDIDYYYQRVNESVGNVDERFSGEENFGRRVDMMDLYMQFTNLKKFRDVRARLYRNETLLRLKNQHQERVKQWHIRQAKKTADGASALEDPDAVRKEADLPVEEPVFDEDSAKVQEALTFKEIDYLKWLSTFQNFHEIPRYCKYRDETYNKYLHTLATYLESFIRRSQPMTNLDTELSRFYEDFNEAWDSESPPKGWEVRTWDMDTYSQPTDRLFTNDVMKGHHVGSAQYMKKTTQMASMTPKELQEREDAVHEADKTVAKMEQKIIKLRNMIEDPIKETIDNCQMKQTLDEDEYESYVEKQEQHLEAMELYGREGTLAGAAADADADGGAGGAKEDDSDDDDDGSPRQIYNPMKLPLGWDGKPIPYWLYKIQQMNRQYICQICGDHSYWGPRAFQLHFSEWRHAQGMRALKIPNTVHFKEITKIEDAVKLWNKLKNDAEKTQFSQNNIEMEDAQGNVMTKHAFDDLRRQGLV